MTSSQQPGLVEVQDDSPAIGDPVLEGAGKPVWLRVPLPEPKPNNLTRGMSSEIAWQILAARTVIHHRIDYSTNSALRYIAAIAERDRRAIGQLTRFDHIQRRFSK